MQHPLKNCQMFKCSSQEISLKVTLMYCCTCIGSNPVKSTIGVSSGVSFLVGGGRSSILQSIGNTAECDVWAQGCRTVILKFRHAHFCKFHQWNDPDEWEWGKTFSERKKITMQRKRHILLSLYSPSYCFVLPAEELATSKAHWVLFHWAGHRMVQADGQLTLLRNSQSRGIDCSLFLPRSFGRRLKAGFILLWFQRQPHTLKSDQFHV